MKRVVFWGVLAATALGFAGCSPKVSNQAIFERVAKRLPDEIAAARKAGLKIDENDLKLNPHVPNKDNAADFYIRIYPGINLKPFENEVRAYRQDRDQTHLANLHDLISSCEHQYFMIDHASLKSHCEFRRDWSLGMSIEYSDTPTMKNAVRLLDYRAWYEAMRGNYAKAQESIIHASRVADHIEEDRGLLPFLHSIECKTAILFTIRRILLDTRGAPKAIAMASQVVSVLRYNDTFRKHVLEEGALAAITIRLSNWTVNSALDASAQARYFIREKPADAAYITHAFQAAVGVDNKLLQDAYLTRHLENMRRYIALIVEGKDPRCIGEEIRMENEKQKSMTDPTGLHSWNAMACDTIGNTIIGYQTRYAITLAAIHAFETKNKTGKYPTTLTDIDPCDGKPLDIQLLPKGGFSITTRGAAPPTPKGCQPIAPLSDEFKRRINFVYQDWAKDKPSRLVK